MRRDARLREQPGDRRDELVVCELRRREVDRDRELAAAGAPPGERPQRGLEHPLADRDDQAVLLGQGTNSAGEITPQRGCVQRSSASRIVGEPSSSETIG